MKFSYYRKVGKFISLLFIFLWTGVAPSEAAVPSPYVYTPTYPSSITLGDYAEIYVRVKNNGDSSDDGAIVISFPTMTDSGDKTYVDRMDSSDDSGSGYKEFAKGDYGVWHKNGYQFDAKYLKVEWWETDWVNGEINYLKIKVKPKVAGAFYFYVRSSMGQGGTYYNYPVSSSYIDQQGWEANRYRITVVAPQPPSPSVSANVTSFTLGVGETRDVNFTLTNSGGISDRSYLDMILSGDVGLEADIVSFTSNWWHSEYPKIHLDGTAIWKKTDTNTSGATLIKHPTAVEAYRRGDWSSGSSGYMTIRIKGKSAGTYYIYYRGAMNPKGVRESNYAPDSFIRDPGSGSIERYTGWYAKKITVTVNNPSPTVSANYSSVTLGVGETKDITFTLSNEGGISDYSYLDINFSDGANLDGLDVVSMVSKSSIWQTVKRHPDGDPIWQKTDTTKGTLTSHTLNYEAYKEASDWSGGASGSVTLRVKALKSGMWYIKYRGSMNPKYVTPNNYSPDTYIRTPASGETDQQAWYAKKITVLVNTAPNASRSSPTSANISVTVGESQTFTVKGTDTDGNLKGAKWYLNGALQATHTTLSGSSGTDSWSHTFNTAGTYSVEALVFDTENANSNLVKWTVDVPRPPEAGVPPNIPPDIPGKPTGRTDGIVGKSYTFSTSAIDQDGDQVRYGWDWGDGTAIEWSPLGNSGWTDSRSHTYSSPGTYTIRVKAKDERGMESRDWSEGIWIDIKIPIRITDILLTDKYSGASADEERLNTDEVNVKVEIEKLTDQVIKDIKVVCYIEDISNIIPVCIDKLFDSNEDGKLDEILHVNEPYPYLIARINNLSRIWENKKVCAKITEIDGVPANVEFNKSFSIYYVTKDGVPYDVVKDGYKFENPGFDWTSFEEWLSTFKLTYNRDLLISLFFVLTQWKGRCFGMSATSVLYFTRPLLKPISKLTGVMEKENPGVMDNIIKYHTSQIGANLKALALGKWQTATGVYNDIEVSIKNNNLPIIIGVGRETEKGGHAVVGYKIIKDITDNEAYISIYDSDVPGKIEQASFDLRSNTFSFLYYYNKALAFFPREVISPDDLIKEVVSYAEQIVKYLGIGQIIGRTVARAKVEVLKRASTPKLVKTDFSISSTKEESETMVRLALADDEGSYSIEVPEGEYLLRIVKDGRVLFSEEKVSVKAGQVTQVSSPIFEPEKIICQYMQTQEKVILRNYVDGELKEEVAGGELKIFSVDKGIIFEKEFEDNETVTWNVNNIAEGKYRIVFRTISGRKFKTKFILDRGIK